MLKIVTNFYKKWSVSDNLLNEINQHPEKNQLIHENRKREAHYVECPHCGKNFFYVTSNYMISTSDMRSIGICEYCGLEITREDMSFVAINFLNRDIITNNDLNNLFCRYFSNCILATNDSKIYEIDNFITEENEFIETFLSVNTNILVEKAKTQYQYFMDDICTIISNDYFDRCELGNDQIIDTIISTETCILTKHFLNYIMRFLLMNIMKIQLTV